MPQIRVFFKLLWSKNRNIGGFSVIDHDTSKILIFSLMANYIDFFFFFLM